MRTKDEVNKAETGKDEGLSSWDGLLDPLRKAFTSRSFELFCQLVSAWVLAPARRTVTGMLLVMDEAERSAHDAYHRLLRVGAWSLEGCFEAVARTVVALSGEGKVVVLLDDTLVHKSGRKVEGAGVFRDAVRSSTRHVVYALGLNLVVLAISVRLPFRSAPVALPVAVRVHHKEGPSLNAIATEMMRSLVALFPDRAFVLCGDGAYASLAGAGIERTEVISRMRPRRGDLRASASTPQKAWPAPPEGRASPEPCRLVSRACERGLRARRDRLAGEDGDEAHILPARRLAEGLPRRADPPRHRAPPRRQGAGRLLLHDRRRHGARARLLDLRLALVHRVCLQVREARARGRRTSDLAREGARACRRNPIPPLQPRLGLVRTGARDERELDRTALVCEQGGRLLRRCARRAAACSVARPNFGGLGLRNAHG